MKILFKILTLPIFLPHLFIIGGLFTLIGKGDSVIDFLDWWIE